MIIYGSQTEWGEKPLDLPWLCCRHSVRSHPALINTYSHRLVSKYFDNYHLNSNMVSVLNRWRPIFWITIFWIIIKRRSTQPKTPWCINACSVSWDFLPRATGIETIVNANEIEARDLPVHWMRTAFRLLMSTWSTFAWRPFGLPGLRVSLGMVAKFQRCGKRRAILSQGVIYSLDWGVKCIRRYFHDLELSTYLIEYLLSRLKFSLARSDPLEAAVVLVTFYRTVLCT